MAQYTTLETRAYKGHNIDKIEDKWGQLFFLVDKDFHAVYSSWVDARRAINGQLPRWQPLSLEAHWPIMTK